jgi:hypothetical protein
MMGLAASIVFPSEISEAANQQTYKSANQQIGP